MKDNIEIYYIVYKHTKILDWYPEYKKEQGLFEKNKHYSILWAQNKLYY
jgi:hypothetical protein